MNPIFLMNRISGGNAFFPLSVLSPGIPGGGFRAAIWGAGQIGSLFGILKDMTDIYIRIAYGAMILVFAVGAVKSGLGAQAAQTFGLPGRLSSEAADFALGIVVFVLGILSYPVAEKIVNSVAGGIAVEVSGLHLDL